MFDDVDAKSKEATRPSKRPPVDADSGVMAGDGPTDGYLHFKSIVNAGEVGVETRHNTHNEHDNTNSNDLGAIQLRNRRNLARAPLVRVGRRGTMYNIVKSFVKRGVPGCAGLWMAPNWAAGFHGPTTKYRYPSIWMQGIDTATDPWQRKPSPPRPSRAIFVG
jgi:hypothetical protein